MKNDQRLRSSYTVVQSDSGGKMMTKETIVFPLIRTKLQRPRLPEDLIPRRRLLDRLHAGADGKLILVSAQAGAGKTTLLAQWLEECPQPSAWLSLDEHDNELRVFLAYLCAAIQTVFPSACENVQSLLNAVQTPPLRTFTTLIINELDELLNGPSQQDTHATGAFILALDDYHTITEPAITELLASLIQHLPQGMHLVLGTRADPWLPLAGLRAREQMTEVRSVDLRFTLEETRAFLCGTTGGKVDPETIRLLANRNEGWAVGLRLAALSMRDQPQDDAFAWEFQGISNLIDGYFASEVLAQHSAEIRAFALRTSVLDRFCAPLCAALTELSAARSQELLEWVARANLFLIPLDEADGWYRYHHLFRDLLRNELRQQHSAADIAGLHTRAGAWFAQHGLIDEALRHLLAADDTPAAVALVARQRYDLTNRALWARLDQYLHCFSPALQEQYPDLLMLKTWLFYHCGRWAELPAALERLEAILPQASLSSKQVSYLQGEISALRSLLYYYAVDPANALASAQQALAKLPRELWIVRTFARLYLAGALQMTGHFRQAYAAIYRGLEEEEETMSHAFKTTLLTTLCFIHLVDADLQGMAQAAQQAIALGQQSDALQIASWAHYSLGQVRYHQNDLAAAERHFAVVVQRPYLNYGRCFAFSACGLALVHQGQGRPEQAQAVLESALAFLLETSNTTLLPGLQAFQAEIALRQGQIAIASHWAAHLGPIAPLMPLAAEFFSPHLTQAKVWLAQDTVASRQQAANLLDKVREFVEATHNTRFTIEVLALQAVLQDGQGRRQAALERLQQALALAQLGGFIRLFVDLGPPIARLLETLYQRGVCPDYVSSILAAFPQETMPHIRVNGGPRATSPADADSSPVVRRPSSLIQPLTRRESEVLALLGQYLSNKEIATKLVLSPATVKSHTLSIYRKLDVRGRQQAVARAKELEIL